MNSKMHSARCAGSTSGIQAKRQGEDHGRGTLQHVDAEVP